MAQNKKKFTVWYKVVGLYTAEVPADSIEEALEKARTMTKDKLDILPGDIVNETLTITGAMENE